MPSAADLPRDVLQRIQSLLPIVDYVRFPAVCTSWRSAAEHNPLPPQSEPMPWLLFFQLDDDEHNANRKNAIGAVAIQFCPQQKTNKSYWIPIPTPLQHFRILNSIDHRLILRNALQEMRIVNPFSSSSWNQICCCCACRSLPPLPSVSVSMPVNQWNRAVTDGTLVLAQLGVYGHSLAYTRLGSDRWINIHDVMTRMFLFVDILPSPSQPGLFYAASRPDWVYYIVFALDFSSFYSSPLSSSSSCPPPTCEFVDMTYNLRVDYIDKENPDGGYMARDHMRLVVSSSELFLVRWRLLEWLVSNEGEGVLVREVDVYKLLLDERPEKRRWARVTTLGGRSFFLGRNQSISLSTLEAPQLKSDCIYFPLYPFRDSNTDLAYDYDELEYELVYNLGDGSWERLYGMDDQSYMQFGWPSVWIIPLPSGME